MKTNKIGKGRRKYLSDYVPGDNGYKYIGEYYRFKLERSSQRKFWIYDFLFAMALWVVFVLTGFVQAEGSRQIYVVLPYSCAFLPLCLMLGDLVKIMVYKDDLTKKQFEGSVVQLRRMTIAIIVLSIVSSIGQVIHIFMNRQALQTFIEIKFLAGCFALFLISWAFLVVQKMNPCEIVDK